MKKKPTKNMMIRSHIAFLAFMAFLFVLIGNLFLIQVIKGEEYRLKAEKNQLSDTIISAHRGTIYDSNMKVIAQSASAWLVYINPSKITTDEQKTLLINGFVEIFGSDEETVTKKVNNKKSGYEKIVGKIDNAQKAKLEEYLDQHSDQKLSMIVGIDPDTKRYYPMGSFAATVIGFTGDGDVGRTGLELQYNEELTGKSGRIITAQNALSGDMPNDYTTAYDAVEGYSLVLTIDEVIQNYLENQLIQAVEETQAKRAYGIVMDVKTGAILGMSSVPGYNPNTPNLISNNKVFDEIQLIQDEKEKQNAIVTARNEQWKNRIVSDSYEPGSVFKLFVGAAALEEGVITRASKYNCTGSVLVAGNQQNCFNHKAHGDQTIAEALPYSCNTFFINLGQRMGKETFFKYFEAFGFTEKTGIDLPGESGSIYHKLENMGISELSSSSFGQTFQITPIQMVTAVASLGNGGKLMTPYVVDKVIDSNGNIVSETVPTMKRQVISETTSKIMCELMEEVVVWGTAKNAYVAGYHVSGKTGTSEKLQVIGENVASFAGFAPADDPQIAVFIAIDEPQDPTNRTGGSAAAPVAGRIFENILPYLNIDPRYTDEELAKATTTAPNLIGQPIESIKSKTQGFTVKIIGSGSEVVAQIPEIGQTMPKGGIIVVYTEEGIDKETAEVPDLSNLSITEANQIATNAGFNIKIAGLTQGKGEVVSYKQSIPAGTTATKGTVITVYFKSKENIAD